MARRLEPLETMLHKNFAMAQVNLYPKYGLEVKWITAAKAIEYHETLAIEKSIQNNPQA